MAEDARLGRAALDRIATGSYALGLPPIAALSGAGRVALLALGRGPRDPVPADAPAQPRSH